MNTTRLRYALAAVLIPAMIAGCREEVPVLPSEGTLVDSNPGSSNTVKGLYILNEGNMGSNKCSIDFYDCTSGYYMRNIYPERNPEVIKELGDVGNDIKIYDNKLFAVVNCSHFVEVMDAANARHIGSVNITNCRYITFNGSHAYVSSYAGPVQIDPETRPGEIIEFDINTLEITRRVVVGYQPEEMVIKDGKLYVANSGGYRYPNYDTRVMVIDLDSFEVEKEINVAINLHRMEMDDNGLIYVSSRGDYNGVGSDIYVIDSSTDEVVDTLGIAASEMHMEDGMMYIISTQWDNTSGKNDISYALYDTERKMKITDYFIDRTTAGEIQLPYGITVNPENGEIFVSDATNYITPGYLYCFNPDGTFKWMVRTGDIPAHFAFME